jgi:hypothetical protein
MRSSFLMKYVLIAQHLFRVHLSCSCCCPGACPEVVAYMEQETQQEVAAALRDQQDRHDRLVSLKKDENALIQARVAELKAVLANKLQQLDQAKVCQH